VELNGSASTDVDGDALLYSWRLITAPAGSSAHLNNPSAVNPTFTADLPGTYVVQLIVNDRKIDCVPSTVTVTTNTLLTPTANAGLNQTITTGATVTLTGSGDDPQGLPLTLTWALTAKPEGSTAVLSNNGAANPTFVGDKPGVYVAQLIVNNGSRNSAPSTVTVTTSNTPPVANPGPSQSVLPGRTVTLDGGGSFDANQDALSYSWSLISRPSDSAATLLASTTRQPAFVADSDGTYVVQLIVNDGSSNSAPATVTIIATQNLTDITEIASAKRTNTAANLLPNGTSQIAVAEPPTEINFLRSVSRPIRKSSRMTPSSDRR